MSGLTNEDGSPAVSSDDFATALFGAVDEEATPAPAPAPEEPASSETPPTTPATTDPAVTPDPATPPDELTRLRQEFEAEKQARARLEASYAGNLKQVQEQARVAAEQAAAEARAAAEAEAKDKAFADQRAQWEREYQQSQDPQWRTAARAYIDGEVARFEGQKALAEAQALRGQLDPVARQLGEAAQQAQLRQSVDQAVQGIQTQGAANLAQEVGAPVAEVQAWLQQPEVAGMYQRVLAYMTIAQQQGLPAPIGLLDDLGNQHRQHWQREMARRSEREAREIAANQEAIVASGATRADGGAGAGAPPAGPPASFDEVTTDMWLTALTGQPRR